MGVCMNPLQSFEPFLEILKARFDKHPARHANLAWSKLLQRLEAAPEKLKVLIAMEESGGEPDVVIFDPKDTQLYFYDCSKESPLGRRSLCYDRESYESRKENKPQNNVIDLAGSLGIELLDEALYRSLQEKEEFDTKTSSWILCTPEVRALGGALFCDRRYGRVFTYHNGAASYYAVRGFRARLKI